MSNVLPLNERKRLVRNIHARYVLVLGIVLSGGAVAAILALLPAYFLAYVPRVAYESASSSVRSDTTQLDGDRSEIARARDLMSAISGVTTVHDTSAAIDAVMTAKPPSISVTSLSFSAGDPVTITVTGMSLQRDAVQTYREALLRDERITKVDVPVAALIGALSSSFTMTVVGSFGL